MTGINTIEYMHGKTGGIEVNSFSSLHRSNREHASRGIADRTYILVTRAIGRGTTKIAISFLVFKIQPPNFAWVIIKRRVPLSECFDWIISH
jgi:hypothetical protein